MARQLTLFWNTPQVAPYFKNAQTDYRKLVNKQWCKVKHGKFGTKNNFLSYIQKEWDEIKNNPIKLNAYLQSNKNACIQWKSPFHFQTLKGLSTEILLATQYLQPHFQKKKTKYWQQTHCSVYISLSIVCMRLLLAGKNKQTAKLAGSTCWHFLLVLMLKWKHNVHIFYFVGS